MDELLNVLHDLVLEMRDLPTPQPQTARPPRAPRARLENAALGSQKVQDYLGSIQSDVLGLNARRPIPESDDER